MRFHHCLVVLSLYVLNTSALAALHGDPADYSLRFDLQAFSSGEYLYVGRRADGGYNGVYIFELPTITPGQTFGRAHLNSATGEIVGSPGFNVDLYGIGFHGSIDPILAFLQGPEPEIGAVLIQDNILTPAHLPYTYFGTSMAGDAALAQYINTFYAEFPNYTGGFYMFLRFSPDAVAPGPGEAYYQIISAEGIARAALPEPGGALLLGVLGWVSLGRRRRLA